MNVSLGAALPGAPGGTWCFVLGGGIDPASVTVVASAVKTSFSSSSLESAQWLADASDCPSHQIEVQTAVYTVQGGNLVSTPDPYMAFSFVVP